MSNSVELILPISHFDCPLNLAFEIHMLLLLIMFLLFLSALLGRIAYPRKIILSCKEKDWPWLIVLGHV
jgi:hypothetical protein